MYNPTNTRHTPGPWYYVQYDSVDPFGKFLISKSGERSIATTTGGALSKLSPENKANARLIAAAPEMLEALERLADHVYRANKDYDALGNAFRAITKATGKE